MIKIIIVTLISFILENVCSIFILNNTNFFNVFFVLTSLILFNKLIKDKNNYYILSIVIGFIYDISFNGIIGFNLLTFFLSAIFFRNIQCVFKSNIEILNYIYFFIFYRLISYIILLLIGYFSFDFYYLLKSIYSSIVLNLIYILLLNRIFLKNSN